MDEKWVAGWSRYSIWADESGHIVFCLVISRRLSLIDRTPLIDVRYSLSLIRFPLLPNRRRTDLRKCRLTIMFNLLSRSVTLVSSVIVDRNGWYCWYLVDQRMTWKDDALEKKWYQWTCPKNSNSLLFDGINAFDHPGQHGRELVHK